MQDACAHRGCIYWPRWAAQHFIASDLATDSFPEITDLHRIDNNHKFNGAPKFDDDRSGWQEKDYMTEWGIYALNIMSTSPCQFQWEYIIFTCNLDLDGLSDADNIVTQKKRTSNYVQEFTDDSDVVIPAANTDILKRVWDKQAFMRAFFLHNYSKSFNILLENLILDILQAFQQERMCTNIFPGLTYTTAKTCLSLQRPFQMDLTSGTHWKWLREMWKFWLTTGGRDWSRGSSQWSSRDTKLSEGI